MVGGFTLNTETAAQNSVFTMPDRQKITITIVYDNNIYEKDLKTGWGFAALVQTGEETFLFDTGGDGALLLQNMEKRRINFREIDALFLSHIHDDHTGGMERFLSMHPAISVYYPASFPASFTKMLSRYGPESTAISEFTKVNEAVYSTGELRNGLSEQSLILKTPEGLIVLTGCAHPGIVEILEYVRQKLDEPLLLAAGGFHLFRKNADQIRYVCERMMELNVKYVAPCHCSGDLAREIFGRYYKDHYIDAGVGRIIRSDALR